MLSRQTYKKVAEILKKYVEDEKSIEIVTVPLKLLVEDFIKLFQDDNFRFSAEKFKKAIFS